MPTNREQIIIYLEGEEYTAKELSGLMRMRVQDVLSDLEHVQRSAGKRFKIRPALCTSCDFEFERRKKLSTPGRCPECRSERVVGPFLSVTPE